MNLKDIFFGWLVGGQVDEKKRVLNDFQEPSDKSSIRAAGHLHAFGLSVC